MSSDCSDVNCLRPECIGKCGSIQWFGNLSPCHVRFEYQAPGGSIWHSLGEYYPGNHTELGSGALWLPREATVRAVDIHTGRVVQNWGRIGAGLASLFVDNSMCSVPAEATLALRTVQKKRLEPLQWSAIALVGVALILAITVFTWTVLRKRNRI